MPPIIAVDGRTLILGSMPGARSLQARQYYAHPRNLFWQIMGELIGFDPALPYPARLEALTRAGLSLWDVLRSCVRKGSLDSAISTGIPNDFAAFFAGHPSLSRVFFNGGKSEAIFRRHVLSTLADADLVLRRLPSTSPAHASMGFAEKLRAWRAVLDSPMHDRGTLGGVPSP
ncbi:MAG: DNA-deoxyinosine glycosylase [Acidisphaera sp.]|nr:DNA-deoxyinosine glycosylase [Acidisphaera sp.]